MKKFTYNLLVLLFTVPLFTGCYEDKSSLDKLKIDDIVINSESMGAVLRVDYLEDITFEPTVKMGNNTNPPEVSYRWEINEIPGSTEFIQIGAERVLKTRIKNMIVSPAYTLVFTAIDNKHGLEYQKSWPLYVSSPFREGIVVAETKDGLKSDLSLIMDKDITTSYNKELTVKRDLWKSATGESHSALIKNITYSLHKLGLFTKNIVTVIFDNKDISMYNCEDYSFYKSAGEIFPIKDQSFDPQGFGTIKNSQWTLVVNNKLYLLNNGQPTVAFIVPSSGENNIDNGIVVHENIGGSGPWALWYDNITGKFHNIVMDFVVPALGGVYSTQGAFDPTSLQGRRSIAADISIDGISPTFLLKNESNGEYELYVISFGYYDSNGNNIPSVPKLKVNLPKELNTIIESATSIFFDMFNPVMYIATAQDIYSVVFGGGVVSFAKKYSAPAGETISKAKLYVQGRYRLYRKEFDVEQGPIYEPPLPLNTKAVVVATKKAEYEGQIYFLTFANQAIGEFNTTNVKKYSGFGKILDFTFQGQ